MRSKVDIYNGALQRIGVRPLVGTSDERDEAVACGRSYEAAVEMVLSANNFQCSIRRARLARLAEAPVFGFTYQYELPADFLHLVELNRPDERGDGGGYSIESGNRMLYSGEICEIIYVRRIDNPAEFSPEVARCVVLALASLIIPQFSENPDAGINILNELEQVALPRARTADNMQASMFRGRRFWTENLS